MQEYWRGLPSPFPVGLILSVLSTMTHLSWVAPEGMAHSFTELDKAVVHVISFCDSGFHSVRPLREKVERLLEASWWERLPEGKWSYSDGRGCAQYLWYNFLSVGVAVFPPCGLTCGKVFKRREYQTTWPASWEICMQVKKQQLEPDMEQWIASKLEKEYLKAVYCHPTYLTYMQSTSWEMLGWRKHKLESRLLKYP